MRNNQMRRTRNFHNKRRTKKFYYKSIAVLTAIIIISALASIIYIAFYQKKGGSAFLNNYGITLPDYFEKDSLLEVHFTDIGQGDAIIINFPDGVTALIDAGTSTAGQKAIEEDYIKYLDSVTTDNTIDYMVVTHPHTDHYNMLDSVLKNYDVKEIFYNQNEENSSMYADFTALAAKEPHITLNEIDHSTFYRKITGENYIFEIFACGDMAFKQADQPNQMSILCLITYNDFQILFTGDCETECEEWFMAYYGDDEDIDIDVLKVAHHGSETSTSVEILDYLEPEYAVISCDDGTKYGHPHEQTMDKLADYGVVTYRTNLHGNIALIADYDGDFAFITEYGSSAQNNTAKRDTKQISYPN